MTIDVTHLSPAAEKPHQEGSHKASPRAHSIPRNLWCKKKVFAAIYLFVLLSALCATPTHWTLKVSLKVLLSSTFCRAQRHWCSGDGWQSALCFCSGKTPKATKAAQQCFLLRMSRGRHLAFILKSYQMRGKLLLRSRQWWPVLSFPSQWRCSHGQALPGHWEPGLCSACSSPWLFLSISSAEQDWSSHWTCWQAAQPAQPSLGTNQILLTVSQIHVPEKAKLFPTPLAIALSLLGSLPCLI